MYYHRYTPFHDDGGTNDPNPDPDITQWDKFLYTYTLNLNLEGYNFVCDRYGISRLLQEYIKGLSMV